jgi:hypothetical protein
MTGNTWTGEIKNEKYSQNDQAFYFWTSKAIEEYKCADA